MIYKYIFLTHLRVKDFLRNICKIEEICTILQNNLNLFSQWANIWQLNISL